jgi:HlyD family secretion protein
VVVAVDNESGKLLPYLTASVRFIVAEKQQALTIPSAATRWKPRPEQVVASRREAYESQLVRPGKKGPKRDAGPMTRATVWVNEGELVRPVDIETGLADGSNVEVVSGAIREGTPVVIGEAAATKRQTKNPFAPSLTKGGP